MVAPTLIINYITSTFIFLIGIFLVSGIFPSTIDPYTRIAFGAIFLAYGVYRFINAQAKRKQQQQQERREKLREEREKLIKNVK